MSNINFDPSKISWQTLGDFEHLWYWIFTVDETSHIVDVVLKFSANEQIVLHRHLALNHTFVVQGEHRLYAADGSLQEIRPTGSYTVSPAKDEPHREGGGDADVIVLFSMRGDGVLYEILDDDFNVIAALAFQDFVNLYHAQANL